MDPPRDEKIGSLPSLYFFTEKNENDFSSLEDVNNNNKGIGEVLEENKSHFFDIKRTKWLLFILI